MSVPVIAGLAAGVVGTILYFLRQYQSNKVLANLSRSDRTKEQDEIAALTQEVQDAKITYANTRVELNNSISGKRR